MKGEAGPVRRDGPDRSEWRGMLMHLLERVEADIDRLDKVAQANALDIARAKGIAALWGSVAGAAVGALISALITWMLSGG